MSIGTVQDLASALRDGRRDPVDLVAEVFDRIDRHNDPALFIRTLRPRAEAEARAARERLRAGNPASLVDGVPLAWKDLFDLKGSVTTAGSAVLRDAAPAAADGAPRPAATGRANPFNTRAGHSSTAVAATQASASAHQAQVQPCGAGATPSTAGTSKADRLMPQPVPP